MTFEALKLRFQGSSRSSVMCTMHQRLFLHGHSEDTLTSLLTGASLGTKLKGMRASGLVRSEIYWAGPCSHFSQVPLDVVLPCISHSPVRHDSCLASFVSRFCGNVLCSVGLCASGRRLVIEHPCRGVGQVPCCFQVGPVDEQ